MRYRRPLMLATTLLVALFFIAYLYVEWDKFAQLQLAHPVFLIPAILLVVVNIYSSGSLMETALQPLGVHLRASERFGLTNITRFCNLIAPSYLSTAVRAVYLKKNYNLAYARYASGFAVSNAVLFLVSGIFAILAYAAHGNQVEGGSLGLAAAVVAALVLFSSILFAPLPALERWVDRKSSIKKQKMVNRVLVGVRALRTIRSSRRLLYITVFWAVMTIATSALMLSALYEVLGYQASLTSVLFISAVSIWSIVISLTPANIGIREGLMAVAAGIMNVPIPETIAVALLSRFITIGVVSLLASYYAPKLLNTSLTAIGSFGQAKNQ